MQAESLLVDVVPASLIRVSMNVDTSTDAEEWLSTRTDERCAKLLEAQRHKSVCDEQNKETRKRESVRDVTTPRDFHKLLGNVLATSRTSRNFSSYLLILRHRSSF